MTTATLDLVRDVLDGVPDPEMPPVSIGELGMVVDVRVEGRRVEIDLVPTYSGCPAIAVIRADVESAVRATRAFDEVEVRFRSDIVWTPERISERAHDKLRAFGIAPPGSGQVLFQIGSRTRQGEKVVCPLCGSRSTREESPFGPTPCRSISYCENCRNPFEVIKP